MFRMRGVARDFRIARHLFPPSILEECAVESPFKKSLSAGLDSGYGSTDDQIAALVGKGLSGNANSCANANRGGGKLVGGLSCAIKRIFGVFRHWR